MHQRVIAEKIYDVIYTKHLALAWHIVSTQQIVAVINSQAQESYIAKIINDRSVL